MTSYGIYTLDEGSTNRQRQYRHQSGHSLFYTRLYGMMSGTVHQETYHRVGDLIAEAILGKIKDHDRTIYVEADALVDVNVVNENASDDDLKGHISDTLMAGGTREERDAFHAWLWGDQEKQSGEVEWLHTPWLGVLMSFTGNPSESVATNFWTREMLPLIKTELACLQGLVRPQDRVGEIDLDSLGICYDSFSTRPHSFRVVHLPLENPDVCAYLMRLTGEQFSKLVSLDPSDYPDLSYSAVSAAATVQSLLLDYEPITQASALTLIVSAMVSLGKDSISSYLYDILGKVVIHMPDSAPVLAQMMQDKTVDDNPHVTLRAFTETQNWIVTSNTENNVVLLLRHTMGIEMTANAIAYAIDSGSPLEDHQWYDLALHWDDYCYMPIEFAFSIVAGSDR